MIRKMDTISLVGALEQGAHAPELPAFALGKAWIAAQNVFAARAMDKTAKQEGACARPAGHCATAYAALSPL